MTRISIGVDLAQERDRTALAAVDSYRGDAVETGRGRTRRPLHHDLVALDRLPAGINYPAQVQMICAWADKMAADGARPTLYVDATGVGRAVLDLLLAESPYPVSGITITPGEAVVRRGRDFSVAKTELIGCLQVALSSGRAHALPTVDLQRELEKEMRAFSYELGATGRPKYEGRGAHDDLVLALALAVWGAERGGGSTEAFMDLIHADLAKRQESAPR